MASVSARRAARRQSRPRVLVLPLEIAGVSSGIVRGLRASGAEADLLLRVPHRFDYERPSSTGYVARLQRILDRMHHGGRTSRLRPHASILVRLLALPVLWRRYDAFVYVGPATLSGFAAERRVAKAFGKVVVTVFLGSEARPPFLDGSFMDPPSGPPDLAAVARLTRTNARRVRHAESASAHVVNSPQSAQFHRRPFIDLTFIGLPAALATGPPARPEEEVHPRDGSQHPVRIVHAPSELKWKGTHQIREAVRQLREEGGLAIDYVELVGMPHETVLQAIQGADLAVDQLYSDVALSAFATECAGMAVPPLVFGYARDAMADSAAAVGLDLSHYHPPESLVDTLRRFVTDSTLRRRVGRDLQRFVREHWDEDAVGRRYLELIQGQGRREWSCPPESVQYTGGYGISTSTRRRFLRAFLAAEGSDALRLDPESPVRRRLLAEAQSPEAAP